MSGTGNQNTGVKSARNSYVTYQRPDTVKETLSYIDPQWAARERWGADGWEARREHRRAWCGLQVAWNEATNPFYEYVEETYVQVLFNLGFIINA